MAELGEGLSGYLDVQDATLRAPRIEAVSNIGISNTAPQHAFSVGSNLYVSTDSSNVLTVDGNVVCEGVKVGLIEIIPSYDFAAVSNVGNVTQSTIQFANATTGFTTTANATIGNILTVDGNASISGNLSVTSNLEAANSKFSLDTNGTLKQIGAGLNNNYIKLMKYFGSGSNWKIATGSYLGASYQWLSIRAKMTRLDVDVKIIQFNYYGNGGISRVRDSIVIGGGGSATQDNEIKVYNRESNSTYEIYLQIDSATSVEVEITHRNSTIDDDYSTVATANNGAIDETGLTKIYDSGTTTDLRLKSGNVGIGKTNPGGPLDIRAGASDPSVPTVHIGDNAADYGGDYGMVNLVRNPANAGSKAHLAFIRNGNTIFSQGFYNNTNTFGFWPSFTGVTNTPAMSFASTGRVGIGTTDPLYTAKLDVRGDGMIFDKAKGDGTILSGLYNYTETQQAIDAGVQGGVGTITASTDIDPPPGTAGDVIAKFVNNAGGEAVTNTWYPGVIPMSVGTVIYFGVWIYATQNIDMEFFRFHDTGAQNVSFSYTTPNKWARFERLITSNRAYNFSAFRFDNNSSGRTVYLTGLTIRVGQSQNSVLPFTPRYSPASGKGAVFTTHNLVAKEAAIKTLTGPVDIGAGLTGNGGGGLLITKEGYVQPGDINTRAGSLKGNYFFQGIYDAYRSGGLNNTSYTSVYERWLQVVRMGSLLTIFGGLPVPLTSTTMNLQFTWAELGLDEPKSITTLINQSSSTYGTWGSATANSTYLILPSTGHAGNGAVDYNNIRYVIDLSFIYQY